ncbi:MAG: PAS domain-containing protein [Candidatus Saliniplasma sp.]
MSKLKQDLSYLMLGQQGGENRIKILEHLKERSYNTNQLAKTLDLNYRTVKYHIDVLLEHDLITSSGEGYGDVFFLSPRLEENFEILEEMKNKLGKIFESPTLYKMVIQRINEGMIILDKDKDIIFLNDCAKYITRYGEKDLLGKGIEELLEFDIDHNLEQLFEKDEFVEKRMKLETPSGETKIVIVTMDNFSFDGEKHKGYSLLMRDISEGEAQREMLDALMAHSGVLMAYLDLNFDLVYANNAYAERTEFSPKELVGKNHFDLFPSEENKKLFEGVIENEKTVSKINKPLLHPDRSLEDEEDIDCVYWTLEPVDNGEEDIKGLILTMCEHPCSQ